MNIDERIELKKTICELIANRLCINKNQVYKWAMSKSYEKVRDNFNDILISFSENKFPEEIISSIINY